MSDWIGNAVRSGRYRYLSRRDKLRIIRNQNGVCALCPKTFLSRDFLDVEFDHIKPISQGGLHTWDNVQALCFKCHSQKTRAETPGTPPPRSAGRGYVTRYTAFIRHNCL